MVYLLLQFHPFKFLQFNARFFSTKIKQLATEVAQNEPLLTTDVLPEFALALEKLQNKLKEPVKKKFYHFKTLKSHILPLTNVAFDRAGTRWVPSIASIFGQQNFEIDENEYNFRCVTGSYDRTARVWNVETGEEMHVLQGHENAVFSVEFNFPKWLGILITN